MLRTSLKDYDHTSIKQLQPSERNLPPTLHRFTNMELETLLLLILLLMVGAVLVSFVFRRGTNKRAAMRPSPSRLSERPSPVAPSFPPRSIVNAQPSATEDIGHARSVAPQPAPLPGNVPPISTHPRGADYMRGADKEIPSRFILGTEKVNQWRERQRSRLASQPSPSLPGLAIGQPPGARAFNLLYAAFLLAAPVGGLYKLAPLFVGFRNNGLKMLCVLVFILIATGMWKLGFRALGEALGRGSRRDVLWTAARRFAKKGNLSASIRYLC